MSDWIEKDGKKYYAEEYITFANKNCERQRKIAEEWLAKCTSLSTEVSNLEGIRDDALNIMAQVGHIPNIDWVEHRRKWKQLAYPVSGT